MPTDPDSLSGLDPDDATPDTDAAADLRPFEDVEDDFDDEDFDDEFDAEFDDELDEDFENELRREFEDDDAAAIDEDNDEDLDDDELGGPELDDADI